MKLKIRLEVYEEGNPFNSVDRYFSYGSETNWQEHIESMVETLEKSKEHKL